MDYSDIIDLPHPVSKRHKPMPMQNRAAQFAPFAALTGYEDAIAETARATEQEIEVSTDLAALLDQRLEVLRQSLADTPHTPVEVSLTYFIPDRSKEGGRHERIAAAVKDIDEEAQLLVLADGRTIKIAHITDLTLDFSVPDGSR